MARDHTPERIYLRNLDGLRGGACLIVIIYHLGEWEAQLAPPTPLLGWLLPFGFCVMDLFFAMSGFIMTWVHLPDAGKPGALRSFAVKRFVRIYPVLWVAFAMFAVWYGTRWSPHRGEQLALLRITPAPVLPHTWSLVYEVSFYAVFAAFLLAPRRWFVPLLAVWTAATVALMPLQVDAGTLALKPFAFEFVCGCWAGLAAQRAGGWRWPLALGISCLAAAIAVCMNVGPLSAVAWWRAAIYGPTFGLILLAAVRVEALGRVVFPRWMCWAGAASYSIYLTHWLSGGVLRNNTRGWGHEFWPHLLWLVVVSVGMIGIGCLTHALIERPILQTLRPRRGTTPKRRRFLGGVVSHVARLRHFVLARRVS